MDNKYFLIFNECISSIGNSLVLKDMLKEFLRTTTKKTNALAAVAFEKETYNTIVMINKKSINFDFKDFLCGCEEQHLHIFDLNENEKIIILYFNSIVLVFKYKSNTSNIKQLANLLFSLDKKINSSVEACRLFEENKRIKETLELAISGANDGLWDWDVAKNSVYFSPRWKSMLGYEDHEISSDFNEWKNRIHPDDKEKALQNVQDYLDGKIDYFENEHRLQHKDGSWIWVLDRGKANFENGTVKKFVGFHTDITKQKTLEENLEQKVQEEVKKNQEKDLMLRQQSRLAQLGEMISMIAHQWRQPLASIASIALTIKLKITLNKFNLSDKKEAETFLSLLESEMDGIDELVQHLTKTIDDFRNFYKPNKDAIVDSINLSIQKSLSIIESQIKQKDIEILTNYQATNKIKQFESELLQVFLNIFKNALDNFTEKNIENKKLIIESHNHNNGVIVTISDNGGGIDKDIIDKIFDPYFSTKSEKNGTGLGLYMSKLIIEQHHNGEIAAHNIQEGVKFSIILKG